MAGTAAIVRKQSLIRKDWRFATPRNLESETVATTQPGKSVKIIPFRSPHFRPSTRNDETKRWLRLSMRAIEDEW